VKRPGAGLAVCVLLGVLLLATASPANASPRRGRCRYDDCRGGRRDGDRRDKRTCFMLCDDIIIVPTPWGPGQGGDKQPPDEQPQSLFPPSFEGIKSFVTATIKGGIDMGRMFADTTITFVENLMMGLA
jgi:hypothetical protein